MSTDLTTFIISPGGTGSSYILDHLSDIIKTNASDDSDRHKHCPTPSDPRLPQVPARVVYVWNDPLLAILSLHRRGWFEVQSAKLKGEIDGVRDLDTLWKLTGIWGRDLYGIDRQARAWLAQHRWPLFFLDMRELENTRGALESFLGLDLPKLIYTERAEYDYDAIPANVRNIYHALDTEICTLGSQNNHRTSN